MKINNPIPVILLALTMSVSMLAAPHRSQEAGKTAEFHLWTFKQGGKFDGKPVQFKGDSQVILVGHDNKQYTIPIAQLTDEDKSLLEQMRPDIEKSAKERLESTTWTAGARQLEAQGYVHISGLIFTRYPERARGEKRYIDCTFQGTEHSGEDWLEISALDGGKQVWASVAKTGGPDLTACTLERGQQVRLIGSITYEETSPSSMPKFYVTDIQVMKRVQ